MILYVFVLNQLNAIQKGIQMTHMFGQMLLDYNGYGIKDTWDLDIRTWLIEDKTIVLLDGGDLNSLEYIYELADDKDNNFCVSEFTEPSLGRILTCVGVLCPKVFPNLVYETKIQNYISNANLAQ